LAVDFASAGEGGRHGVADDRRVGRRRRAINKSCFSAALNREVWNEQVEKNATLTGAALAAFRDEYFRRPFAAFKFNKKILAYHTVTDRWFELDELPFAPRCGAAVLRQSDGSVLVAGGEIGPGVRTPDCAVGTFCPGEVVSPTELRGCPRVFHRHGTAGILLLCGANKNSDDYFRGGGGCRGGRRASASMRHVQLDHLSFGDRHELSFRLPLLRHFNRNSGFGTDHGEVLSTVFSGAEFDGAYEYLEMRFNLVVPFVRKRCVHVCS
jgi:hypothetical protein